MKKRVIYILLVAFSLTACDYIDGMLNNFTLSTTECVLDYTKNASGGINATSGKAVLTTGFKWTSSKDTDYIEYYSVPGTGQSSEIYVKLTKKFVDDFEADMSQFPLGSKGYYVGSIWFQSEIGHSVELKLYYKGVFIQITDPIFQIYCIRFDSNQDGRLAMNEALVVDKIDINGLKINRLNGIEHFRNLKHLNCSNNNVTSLTLINELKALTYLDCSNNSIASLDVKSLSALEHLNCSGNSMKSLNVTGLDKLDYLNCSYNSLSSLIIKDSKILTHVNCSNNYSLSTFNFEGLSALTYMNCSNNSLRLLDLSGQTVLEELYCSNNGLTSLSINNLSVLTTLSCYDNSLESINVDGLNALNIFSCFNNSLTSLDVSNLTALQQLSCSGNPFTSLDIKGLNQLIRVYCGIDGSTDMAVQVDSDVQIGEEASGALAVWAMHESKANFDRIVEKDTPVHGVTVKNKE